MSWTAADWPPGTGLIGAQEPREQRSSFRDERHAQFFQAPAGPAGGLMIAFIASVATQAPLLTASRGGLAALGAQGLCPPYPPEASLGFLALQGEALSRSHRKDPIGAGGQLEAAAIIASTFEISLWPVTAMMSKHESSRGVWAGMS
jgi:hypothetical protein